MTFGFSEIKLNNCGEKLEKDKCKDERAKDSG